MILNFSVLRRSFVFAGRGLVKAFKEEQNLRVQSFLALVVAMAGWFFKITIIEWMFLLVVITLVLIMEIINSAVERLSDILKPRINTYVKEIKDVMAAGVILASLLSVVIGLLIFSKYIWRFFYGI